MANGTLSTHSPQAVEIAAETVRGGGIIVYPTETVYGLGVSVLSVRGINRLYSLKGREKDKPVSILIGSISEIDRLCAGITGAARMLMTNFWPGPLTIVFKASGQVPAAVQSGSGTIGIRYPAHWFCQELARALGHPLTATSANLSGAKPAHNIAEVDTHLAHQVDLLIDGGTCAAAPSTVVDVTREDPVILRQGAITEAEIRLSLRDMKNG